MSLFFLWRYFFGEGVPGWVLIAAGAAAAAATSVWLMRDLRMESIAAAVAIGVPVAAAASVYGRRLAVGH